MNRRSIVIASALLITAGVSTANAQMGMASRTSFGVLAGGNFANLSGSDVNGAKNRTGFVAGVALDFNGVSGFGVEVDGLYSQEGAKIPSKGGDATLKLDYVQVPVLLKYRFQTHTPVRPFIVLGPYAAFRAKCDVELGGSSTSCADFTGSNAKSTDFGGTAGAGVGFSLGKQELSISARYNMGFTKIFSNSNAENKVISVLAGLSF
jgi:hypothetical protein